MRNTVPLQRSGGGGDADGDGDSEAGVSCSCWWRLLPEYEAGAGLETPKAAPRNATARLRVVREMERLAAAASESIDELRHRLLTYKAGDLWFPAGGIAKQDTDIPPVITLLLLGYAGVGKSSLVNLMYSVLGRSGFVPFAHTVSPAGEFLVFKRRFLCISTVLKFSSLVLNFCFLGKEGRTLNLEEHNVLRSMKSGFCVFDSPGLDYDRMSEGFDEVSHWVEDGVRHRQLCHVSTSSSSSFASFPSTSTSTSSLAKAGNRFMRRRVNCAVVVASLSELHRSLVSGHLQPLDAIRQLFHHPSIRESCSKLNST